MTIEYFKKLGRKTTLYNSNVYPHVKYAPRGCKFEEVEQLEKFAPQPFPQAYKEYLFLAGKEHFLLWPDVIYRYEDTKEMQEDAVVLMHEDGYVIPGDFWVIQALANDQFHFFFFNEGPNPPVYHWLGSDEHLGNGYKDGYRKVCKSLSRFYQAMIPTKLEYLLSKRKL